MAATSASSTKSTCRAVLWTLARRRRSVLSSSRAINPVKAAFQRAIAQATPDGLFNGLDRSASILKRYVDREPTQKVKKAAGKDVKKVEKKKGKKAQVDESESEHEDKDKDITCVCIDKPLNQGRVWQR